jgi:hypothetical protein
MNLSGNKNMEWSMPRAVILLTVFLLFPVINLSPDSYRTIVEDTFEVSPERPAGSSATLGINSAVIFNIGGEIRFLRGIELEITAPQVWLSYRGALVMAAYNNISPQTASGIADMDGSRIAFEPLPSKLQIVYQIPVRQSHGLRTTPYVTVPTGIIAPSTFPLLFSLSPVMKGLTNEFENMTFNITVRPILSDEGAVRITTRFPAQLRNRPITVLINDNVITSISELIFLREGEHHLLILSDDYRNESRRFVVERARILDLVIELQDTAPLLIFEAPQNARVFLDNVPVTISREPVKTEPGQHEVRFQIGDYTVIRTLNVQRGKTYRVDLEVDLTINEIE